MMENESYKSLEKIFPNDDSFNYLEFPFYWIAQLESLYSLEMDKTLKKIGMDVSRWRVGILLRVHDQLKISEIANNSLIKISTVTKIVQRMEKEKLVTVFKNEDDGRVRLAKLTSLGQEQVDLIVKTTAPMFKTVFANFSQEEIESFILLNQKLFHNLRSCE